MKRVLLLSILILALFLPLSNLEANSSCSKDGHTVIFINGILNTEKDAEESLKELIKIFDDAPKNDNVIFKLGYNPSRYAGLADTVQAVAQSLYTKVTNFDRDTILMQVHPEIGTQKILLVGHSQGSFYANELYRYLIENGLPKESVGVYHVASPASEVADTLYPGDGDYLTSTNDNTIWEIRGWAEFFNSPRPLEPNILIRISNPNTAKMWRGHSFSGEYLSGAPARIVRDIDKALSQLKTNQNIRGVEGGCYNPPEKGVAYNMKKGFFALTEPAVDGVVVAYKTGTVAGTVVRDAYGKGLDAVAGAFGSGINKVSNLFKSNTLSQNQGGTATLATQDAGNNDDNEIQNTEVVEEESFEEEVIEEPQEEVVIEEAVVEEEIVEEEVEEEESVETDEEEEIDEDTEDNAEGNPTFSVTPGFGGGGGGGGGSSNNDEEEDQEEEGDEGEEEAPSISI